MILAQITATDTATYKRCSSGRSRGIDVCIAFLTDNHWGSTSNHFLGQACGKQQVKLGNLESWLAFQ